MSSSTGAHGVATMSQQQWSSHHSRSRDPGGLNSLGVEVPGSKDPMGLPPPEGSPLPVKTNRGGGGGGGAPPPTPTRRNYIDSTPVMALLAGEPPAPPPPPDDSQPNKRRHGRRSLTARSPRSASSPRERRMHPPAQILAPSPTARAGRRAATYEELPSSPGERRQNDIGRLAATYEELPSAPGERRQNDVVQNRLRQARAIYHSDMLIQDPSTGDSLLGRYATLGTTAGVHSVDQENELPPKVAPTPNKYAMDSPMSAATEPIANHAPLSQKIIPPNAAEETPQEVSQDEDAEFSVESYLPSSQSHSISMSSHGSQKSEGRKKSISPSTRSRKYQPKSAPNRIRRALTPERHRIKTLEITGPDNHQRDRRRSTGEHQQGRGKRNFFRKMFRTKRKKNKDDGSSTLASELAPSAQSPDSRRSRRIDSNRSCSSSGSSEDNERNTYGTMNSLEGDQPEVFFAHDEVSTLTAPTVESARRRNDPKEHVESMIPISDPMGRYWENMHIAQKSVDEAQKSPSIDPFTEPFFRETDGTFRSPDVPSGTFREPDGTSPASMPRKETGLHLDISKAHDPLGESPISTKKPVSPHRPDTQTHSIQDPSPRGWQQPASSFADQPVQDPVGESPLHKHLRGPSAFRDGSPYAPDPPLHVQNSKESVFCPERPFIEEEKKSSDDNNFTHNKFTTTVNTVEIYSSLNAPPPPPPPLPPPPNSKNSLQRCRNEGLKKIVVSSLRDSKERSTGPSASEEDLAEQSIISNGTSPFVLSQNVRHQQTTSPQRVELASSTISDDKKYGMISEEAPTTSHGTGAGSAGTISTSPVRFDGKCYNRLPNGIADIAVDKAVPGDEGAQGFTKRSIRSIVSGQRSAPFSAARSARLTVGDLPTKSGQAMTFGGSELKPKQEAGLIGSSNLPGEETSETKVQAPASESEGPLQRKAKKKKKLTISSAARMNAKAVAYLHTLNGEPSPRHTWRHAELSDDEPSPANAAPNAKFILWSSEPTSKRPSKETTHHSPRQYHMADNGVDSKRSSKATAAPSRKNHKAENGEDLSKLFSTFSAKFKGRKPKKPGALVPCTMESTGKSSRRRKYLAGSLNAREKPFSLRHRGPLARDIRINRDSVVVGIAILRQRREDDIACGKAFRVVCDKRATAPKVQSYFGHERDPEPKDPIQRAGRRLLAKAAVPIQSAARRYFAQREAVDRMWALLEIQTYMRRWIAEASLLANRHAALLVQRVFRGASVRSVIQDLNTSANHIQRIVRGYLAAVRTYDAVYRIILIQARARGNRERQMIVNLTKYAIVVQSAYHGMKARKTAAIRLRAICKLQALWRSYTACLRYFFDVVDIIIVQNIARRWLAGRKAERIRDDMKRRVATKIKAVWRCYMARTEYLNIIAARKIQAIWRGSRGRKAYEGMASARKIQALWRGFKAHEVFRRTVSAIKIQAIWRGFQGYTAFRKTVSAIKIQAIWRGFQGYTDYIFFLIDVLHVQRAARSWLAKRKANCLRRYFAALKIQTQWRRFRDHMKILYEFVHIIQVQSVIRRFLVRFKLERRHAEINDVNRAAAKIQAGWRRFSEFSQYEITRFEVVRLQALFRGELTRRDFTLKLGCCIMIQCAMRRYIAVQQAYALQLSKVHLAASSHAMRERRASEHVQFWWRVVLDCNAEKKAALIIERFFLMVKAEVDREIRRVEKKNSIREQRRRKKNEVDDMLLEKVWLNTVDENHVDVFALSPSPTDSATSRKSHSTVGSRKSCNSAASRKSLTTTSSRQSSSKRSEASSGHSRRRRKTAKKRSVRHRASSPPMNLVMRHEYESQRSDGPRTRRSATKVVSIKTNEEATEISGLTAPSPGYTRMSPSRKANLSNTELEEDLSLEEAFLDAEIRQDKEIKDLKDRYFSYEGVHTEPSKSSGVQHFFRDELDSPVSQPTNRKSKASRPKSWAGRESVGSPSPSHSRNDNVRPKRATSGSPRHGNILVMNPYPEYSSTRPRGVQKDDGSRDTEHLGEQFGMI